MENKSSTFGKMRCERVDYVLKDFRIGVKLDQLFSYTVYDIRNVFSC